MGAVDVRELQAGPLRFSALEMGRGPLVVCLHGFPDHATTFRHLLPALAESGYRALALTMRGYEPSSQPPDGRYDVPALAGDVLAWLDALGVEQAHLVGHDWGAVVGYRLAQSAPHRLTSLTAMAVPWLGLPASHLVRYPGQLRRSWYMGFFQLRGLSEALVAAGDFALLARLWRDWSPGWRLPPEQWRALSEIFRQPGVVGAALSYYRAAANPRNRGTRRWWAERKRPAGVPTLALTGADDGCIDTRLFDRWPPAHFPAGLSVERVEDAGHFLHLEQPGRVNRRIVGWLDGLVGNAQGGSEEVRPSQR